MSTGEQIKRAVREELIRRKWTINYFANMCEDIMSRSTFHNWMSGRNSISEEKASKVMHKLGLTVSKE